MDFIQSAIEKARAERARRSPGQGGDGAGGGPTRPPEAPGARPEPDAAWEALRAFTPRPAQLSRHHVHALRGGGDSTAFDIMRTKLLHQLRSNGWRRVAITSPTPACGKTTLALNLAFSLARQPDVRAMLLEFDMRRPSMAGVLGLREAPQFSRALSREDSPEAHMLRVGRNLALAVNARSTPDSAEMLQQVETGRVVDAVEAAYAPDVMLFDMPPMLATDDAMAFIDQIDCVLLVAAAGTSNMGEIMRCTEELSARCNFLGVVLNKCRYLDSGDAYGYGYGGYGY